MEDNSVLLEDSNMEETLGPRKSMSQPSLAVVEHQGTGSKSTTPKPGLTGAFSASNVRSIPIIQTWHENEELKGKMYTMRCEVQMFERRYLEAKQAAAAPVQQVLDEYVSLKIAQEDMEDKSRQFVEMEEEMRQLQEKAESSSFAFARQAAEFDVQRAVMEQKIRELEQQTQAYEANNTTFGSLRGTLDDIMKKDDPNFTLTADDEQKRQLENQLHAQIVKVTELENHIRVLQEELGEQSARLAETENLRVQLEAAAGHGILGPAGAASTTFAIEKAGQPEVEEQLKYIDELETKLTAANDKCEKAGLALVEYMNKCSKLEYDLHHLRKNVTFDNSSMLVAGKTSEELKVQIDKVNGELNTLRAENRELRIRCDQLTGGDGNLSVSLGQSRLLAGISTADHLGSANTQNETGGTSMRIHPDESLFEDLQDSHLPLMDTTAAKRNKEEFDAVFAAYQLAQNGQSRNTMESSFNSSMPPPDRDATQSFLSQKGFKNSPLMLPKSQKPLQSQQPDQIQNNSFSTKNASALVASPHMPLLQDVQQILDSSAVLLEGHHDANVKVEQMQVKMTQIRDALSRLFERLKSSAALFEDILEKMGSSSPLADRIKQMKLAFETSLCDHADVSVYLEAAERDLTNISLNFTNLEKSIIGHSFLNDVSRRFSIAPGTEDIASSSLLNASYSPIFKFDTNNTVEVEKLKKELAEMKNELEMARARELKSPIHSSPSRLSDVQIKAAQNFEELEVCQATLKKVESEKNALAHELAELEATHHLLSTQLGEARQELDKALGTIATEQRDRYDVVAALGETQKQLIALENQVGDQNSAYMGEMERRLMETREQAVAECQEIIDRLQNELKLSIAEEESLRDYKDRLHVEVGRLKQRTSEAEEKVEAGANEKQQLIEQIVELENQLERLTVYEKQSTDCAAKIAAKKKEIESAKLQDEVTKEAVEGLRRIQKELSELTKQKMKRQIVNGDVSSIRSSCEEICTRLTEERATQHNYAKQVAAVNDMLEKEEQEKQQANKFTVDKENAPPTQSTVTPGTSSQKTASKFHCPTRQMLHESTMAVDAIVQKLKKAAQENSSAMAPDLKTSFVQLITESRTLRDFLHQKLNLFKGIDVTNWKNETVEQLLERLERCYQDNLILEEEIRKYKKEMKQLKAAIPNLGADVQEAIKREIGGIAKDMRAVKELRRK
ncbi:unnamed protein product [Caenorhabditis sp. 36 PRJEB53466]|nr:unnamed protein product [Caenorhabditis sp. 36 PRJEB53466]